MKSAYEKIIEINTELTKFKSLIKDLESSKFDNILICIQEFFKKYPYWKYNNNVYVKVQKVSCIDMINETIQIDSTYSDINMDIAINYHTDSDEIPIEDIMNYIDQLINNEIDLNNIHIVELGNPIKELPEFIDLLFKHFEKKNIKTEI